MALKASDMVKKPGAKKGGKKSKSDQLIDWIGSRRGKKVPVKGKGEEDDGED